MIAIVLALVVVALASALLLGTTLHSGGSSGTGGGAPGVAMADRLQAQQSLNTGLTAAESAAAAAGGLSAVSASQLEQSNPSITFVAGSSTGPTTVSVTVSAVDGSSSTAGGDQSTGGAGVPNIPGMTGGGASGGDGAGTSGTGGGANTSGAGAITLADRSSDNVCWLIWKSSGSATFYGAQTGLTSCSAPQLAAPPTPGPVSADAIGWQEESFPTP